MTMARETAGFTWAPAMSAAVISLNASQMHLVNERMLKQRPLGSSGTSVRELKQKVTRFGQIKVDCQSVTGCFIVCYLFWNPAGARSGFQRRLAGFVQSDGLLIIFLCRHV